MSLGSGTYLEVRTAGSDTNGGGFVNNGGGGTDYSQQNAAQYSYSDLASTTGTTNPTVVTSASHSFVSADVGNLMHVSGTNWTTGWYQIVSVSAGAATLDRAAGTAATLSAGVWAEGGALASPAIAVSLMNGASIGSYQNRVWIKAGTYLITSATTNVSGGCLSSSAQGCIFEGYNTTRGDLGTAPVLTASGISSATLITFLTNDDPMVKNISVNGASLTSIIGWSCGRGTYLQCTASNCTNGGFTGSGGALLAHCVATGCSSVAGFAAVGSYSWCEAYSNTVTPFNSLGSSLTNCIAYNNTGASTDGFYVANQLVQNCVAYGNGRHGYNLQGNSALVANCIAEANAGYGFSVSSSACLLPNNAAYNNASGAFVAGSTDYFEPALVTGTGSFFVTPGSNFALNNNAGAGASARAAGYPITFPASGTLSYADIGAAQHQDSGTTTNLFVLLD